MVLGPIRDKWASLGWERSSLGYPTTDTLTTPDGVGRFNHFQGGSIYWSPQTGDHVVTGAIRDKWAELGWERGDLGYPTTDQQPPPTASAASTTSREAPSTGRRRPATTWSPRAPSATSGPASAGNAVT